jgi:type II secretory pathway pseudopilin PulG
MRRVIDHRRAFTLLELILILAVLVILAAMLLPTGGRRIAKGPRIQCVVQLRNIGLAYRVFSTDNHDLFPWQLTTNAPMPATFDEALRYYRAISNELSTPKILVCPSDNRKAARDWVGLSRTNISYFISLNSSETYPQSLLAGDRNILTNGVPIGPGIVKVGSTITNFGWDGTIHRLQGNCTMGDGSVQQLSSARFRQQIGNTGLISTTLAVP